MNERGVCPRKRSSNGAGVYYVEPVGHELQATP